jgi:hypothetical protein
MLDKLKNLFSMFSKQTDRNATANAPALRQTGMHKSLRPKPPSAEVRQPNKQPAVAQEDLSNRIESLGPGKNVLIRSKYLREDSGTHETLTILDDSLGDAGEEAGFDPYNTGGFDRSKNWNKRFGK